MKLFFGALLILTCSSCSVFSGYRKDSFVYREGGQTKSAEVWYPKVSKST
jgi:hypothetical protein